MKLKKPAWDTEREVTFISKLGTFSKKLKLTRLSLLMMYIQGARNRNNWEYIDSKVAIAHAFDIINIILASEARHGTSKT